MHERLLTDELRILSLWQPWASLMPLRVKRIETRSWSTSYRGLVVIHAAQRVKGRRGERTVLGDFELERDAAGYLLRGAVSHPYRLPLGAAVAVANLVDVVPIVVEGASRPTGGDYLLRGIGGLGREVIGLFDATGLAYGSVNGTADDHPWTASLPPHHDVTADLPYGDYRDGRFAWLFADIEPLRDPIPWKGGQGLRHVPDDLRALIAQQVGEVDGG